MTGDIYSLSESGKNTKCSTAVRNMQGIDMITGHSSVIAEFIVFNHKTGGCVSTVPACRRGQEGPFKFGAQPGVVIQWSKVYDWVGRRDENTGCKTSLLTGIHLEIWAWLFTRLK